MVNKNLLQQMESIYKAWFIDYIPFDGERPINWEKSSIYTIANIIYGAPFASKLFNTDGEGVPIIRIRDLKEQAFVTYTIEKHPKGKAFVLFTIKPLLFEIEQTQVATTVIHIGKKDYDAFEFYLPDEKTLNQFDTITSPMVEQVVINSLENKRLSELRDSLLTRLMSGEIDVSNLDF